MHRRPPPPQALLCTGHGTAKQPALTTVELIALILFFRVVLLGAPPKFSTPPKKKKEKTMTTNPAAPPPLTIAVHSETVWDTCTFPMKSARRVAFWHIARDNGHIGGVWNGEQFNDARGLVQFSSGAGVVLPAAREEVRAHYDRDAAGDAFNTAIDRWARERGFAAGIWTGESLGGGQYFGVMCFVAREALVEVHSVSQTELETYFVNNVPVAATRWANAKQFMIGIWTGEVTTDGAYRLVCVGSALAHHRDITVDAIGHQLTI